VAIARPNAAAVGNNACRAAIAAGATNAPATPWVKRVAVSAT
jgi:hypothetical protein